MEVVDRKLRRRYQTVKDLLRVDAEALRPLASGVHVSPQKSPRAVSSAAGTTRNEAPDDDQCS